MVCGLILAGGRSSRFGEDKAMLGGVERIASSMRECGFDRVIVLCGEPERGDLFEEECWPDPSGCDGLLDVMKWVISSIDDEIQLAPCDALYLDAAVLGIIEGVPMDGKGIRQPLLARLPRYFTAGGDSLGEMMHQIPSQDLGEDAWKVRNVNHPDDLLDEGGGSELGVDW